MGRGDECGRMENFRGRVRWTATKLSCSSSLSYMCGRGAFDNVGRGAGLGRRGRPFTSLISGAWSLSPPPAAPCRMYVVSEAVAGDVAAPVSFSASSVSIDGMAGMIRTRRVGRYLALLPAGGWRPVPRPRKQKCAKMLGHSSWRGSGGSSTLDRGCCATTRCALAHDFLLDIQPKAPKMSCRSQYY